VYLLLRLAFLESIGRTELLEHSGLRRVLVFRRHTRYSRCITRMNISMKTTAAAAA
jgi:hypothetical protein